MKLNKEVLSKLKKDYINVTITKAHEDQQGKRIVEGYAAMYGPDRNYPLVVLTPEAMKTAESDLATNTTVFENHYYDRAIGKVLSSNVDETGLWVKIMVSKSEDEVWTKITEGVLNSFSIGFSVLDYVVEFNEELQEEMYVVRRAEFLEVSIVGLPANAGAKVAAYYIEKSLKKNQAGGDGMDKVILYCSKCNSEKEIEKKELEDEAIACSECGTEMTEKETEAPAEEKNDGAETESEEKSEEEAVEESEEKSEEEETEESEEEAEEEEEASEEESEEKSEEESEESEEKSEEEAEEDSEEKSEEETEEKSEESEEESEDEGSEEEEEPKEEEKSIEGQDLILKAVDGYVNQIKSMIQEIKDAIPSADDISEIVDEKVRKAFADMPSSEEFRKSLLSHQEEIDIKKEFSERPVGERLRIKLEKKYTEGNDN